MKQTVRSFHIENLLGVLELRKLEALKVGGVQKEKNTFCELESFFFLAIFSLFLFLCILKRISRA
jgi:hypothetical protein